MRSGSTDSERAAFHCWLHTWPPCGTITVRAPGGRRLKWLTLTRPPSTPPHSCPWIRAHRSACSRTHATTACCAHVAAACRHVTVSALGLAQARCTRTLGAVHGFCRIGVIALVGPQQPLSRYCCPAHRERLIGEGLHNARFKVALLQAVEIQAGGLVRLRRMPEGACRILPCKSCETRKGGL